MTEYLYEAVRRLIAFDTVSAKSDVAAMEYLAAELGARNFKVASQTLEIAGVTQSNLVAWAGPPRADGLIISGHVDTVPFEGQSGWTREALRLEAERDRLYGRGTTDMKGFIAGCLAAAAQLDLARLKHPLVFVFTADEEVGCLGAEKIGPALKQMLGDTPVPRLAWIGEPTSWLVSHVHKSIVLFDIVVRGIGGHSGAPAAGVNAIAVMGKVIEAIGAIQKERQQAPRVEYTAIFPDAPYDVLNFGTIHGGMAVNMIAEECLLKASYRTMPDVDPMALYREIERRIAAIDLHDYAAGGHRAKIELKPPMIMPPLNSPRGTPLETALFEATGARDSGGVLFGTDGGWFERSEISSIICGPGDFDQAHQPDEFIRRDAFERTPATILKVIDRLCCS
ncbi:MAG: acetylornithine deacetylase [Candidatus Binataceae bacterium]